MLKPGGEITLTQSSINIEQLVGKYIFGSQRRLVGWRLRRQLGGKRQAAPAAAAKEGRAGRPGWRGRTVQVRLWAAVACGPLHAPRGALHAAQPTVRYRTAVLQGLDKVTARIQEIVAAVDQETAFGTLAITPKACLETPPTEPPESAAFLVIDEVRADGTRKRLFSGWMFASTPSISALEDPIYDVWVLSCRDPVAPEEPVTPPTNGNAKQ